MSTDSEIVSFAADRLVNIYGENENVDFIIVLRKISDRLSYDIPTNTINYCTWTSKTDCTNPHCIFRHPPTRPVPLFLPNTCVVCFDALHEGVECLAMVDYINGVPVPCGCLESTSEEQRGMIIITSYE